MNFTLPNLFGPSDPVAAAQKKVDDLTAQLDTAKAEVDRIQSELTTASDELRSLKSTPSDGVAGGKRKGKSTKTRRHRK